MAEELVANMNVAVQNLGLHITHQGQVMETISDQLTSQNVTNEVKSYDGEQSRFKEWINDLEKYSLMNNFGDAQKIRAALQTSNGIVSDFVFRWQSETNEESKTWETLRKELTSRFSLVSDARHAKNMMRRIKQKNDESITAYHGRLYNLATEAYDRHSLNKSHVQLEMIECFIDGLHNSKLKFKLMERNPQTLDQAVQIAHADQNLRKMFNLRTARGWENAETPMEVDQIRKKKCNFCQRFGHIESDCRTKQTRVHQQNEVDLRQNVSSFPNRTTAERTVDRSYVCFFCGRPGHFRRNCFLYQKHKNPFNYRQNQAVDQQRQNVSVPNARAMPEN